MMSVSIVADRLKDEIQIHYDARLSESGEIYESVIGTLEKYMSAGVEPKLKGLGRSVVEETALYDPQSECIKGVFVGSSEVANILRIDLEGKTATIIGDRLFRAEEYFPKQAARMVFTFKELGL